MRLAVGDFVLQRPWFALEPDSPAEEQGFEPLVPRESPRF
jgi:hypothetical protein